MRSRASTLTQTTCTLSKGSSAIASPKKEIDSSEMSAIEPAASHPITVGTIAKTRKDSALVSAVTMIKMILGAASELREFLSVVRRLRLPILADNGQ